MNSYRALNSAHPKDKEEFSLKVSQLCVVALPPLYDSYLSARRSPQPSICLNDFFSMEAGMK